MKKYKPKKRSTTIKIDVRGLQYAVHTWGEPEGTPVMLLHGWADNGMSFQFVADSLPDDWYLVAPDWRGFGDSDWDNQGYWFPDYLADLDSLLNYFDDNSSMRLVGHSMGGNIACLYAGIRPHRVSHLVSLDVIGLPDSEPLDAPLRYRKWLDQLQEGTVFSNYKELTQLVRHIHKLAPNIPDEHACFIAENWSQAAQGGGFEIKADPAHKRINPVLYRRQEARACWQQTEAKTMLVFGEDSRFYKDYYEDSYKEDFRNCFSNLREESISDSAHMIHLQQPEKLARLLDDFLKE